MDLPESGSDRRRKAYHEAGHVIAGLLFGHRFISVTTRPAAPGEDREEAFGAIRGRARDIAVVRLAGTAASARIAGTCPGADPLQSDDDTADTMAAHRFIDDWAAFVTRTYGGSPVTEQLWDETDRRTRDLVEENWRAIETLAEVLLERETLSYNDVLKILDERCPDFRPGKEHDGAADAPGSGGRQDRGGLSLR